MDGMEMKMNAMETAQLVLCVGNVTTAITGHVMTHMNHGAMKKYRVKETEMEDVSRITQFLWKVLEGDVVANVATREKEITISILRKNRWKRFRGLDENVLMLQILDSFKIA